MLLEIMRYGYTPMGTFGVMYIDGVRLVTVERPWINNEPNISCIPEGTYVVKPRRYYRGDYDAMEVVNVEGRSYILFHIGNTYLDSAGCILVTSREGCVNGMWGGVDSRNAFGHFMSVVGGAEHDLMIRSFNEYEFSTKAV